MRHLPFCRRSLHTIALEEDTTLQAIGSPPARVSFQGSLTGKRTLGLVKATARY
jgi:hypothetical protein